MKKIPTEINYLKQNYTNLLFYQNEQKLRNKNTS